LVIYLRVGVRTGCFSMFRGPMQPGCGRRNLFLTILCFVWIGTRRYALYALLWLFGNVFIFRNPSFKGFHFCVWVNTMLSAPCALGNMFEGFLDSIWNLKFEIWNQKGPTFLWMTLVNSVDAAPTFRLQFFLWTTPVSQIRRMLLCCIRFRR
jgi:hypothetical protein